MRYRWLSHAVLILHGGKVNKTVRGLCVQHCAAIAFHVAETPRNRPEQSGIDMQMLVDVRCWLSWVCSSICGIYEIYHHIS